MKQTFFLLILFSLKFTSLVAWGEVGHAATAQIAYEELSPEIKTKFDSYVDAFSKNFPAFKDYHDLANALDDSHFFGGLNLFASWHHTNLINDPKNLLNQNQRKEIFNLRANDDIRWAIKESVETLKSPKASDLAKGFALMFLLHFAGDIHQPLHCASYYDNNFTFPRGDIAGNKFKINYRPNQLHSLADQMFGVGKFGKFLGVLNKHQIRGALSAEEFTKRLNSLVLIIKKENPKTDRASILDPNIWAEESAAIAREKFYTIKYNSIPSPEYIAMGQEVCKQRVAIGGYRLGALLNSILKDSEVNR